VGVTPTGDDVVDEVVEEVADEVADNVEGAGEGTGAGAGGRVELFSTGLDARAESVIVAGAV